MNDWVKVHLDGSKVLSSTQREAFGITLKWYFGYCSRKNLKDPCDRENGKIFWKDAVLTKKSTDWQREQWGAALHWFFNDLVANDRAGPAMRTAIRRRHLAYATEKAYMNWLRRFQVFLHPRNTMAATEQDVVNFLTHLAEESEISATGQNQCFNALLYFFRYVLKKADVNFKGATRAKKRIRVPVVLSQSEVARVLENLSGPFRLMGRLQYGAGLRIKELVRLRVKDVDFDRGQLVIKGGKGDKDRITVLPGSLVEDLQNQLIRVRKLHADDLASNFCGASMPLALARKFSIALSRRFLWDGKHLRTATERHGYNNILQRIKNCENAHDNNASRMLPLLFTISDWQGGGSILLPFFHLFQNHKS